jgi:nitrile hydratase
MDGIHDLGGLSGFGAVDVESGEPTFHERWEAIAFAFNILGISVLRAYNVDEYRHAVERMEPRHYLAASYYERVLTGVATLLVEKGMITRGELNARLGGEFPLSHAVAAGSGGKSTARGPARFAVGAAVTVRNIRPSGHTRVPRYVRGKRGTVVHVAPPFPFPDAMAHGGGRRDEHTYHVRFEANELWPSDPAANDVGSSEAVIVDLWESYLEAAV